MLPSLYDSQDVGRKYNARLNQFVEAGQNAKLKPASKDSVRTLVLNIDNQGSFVNPDGELFVQGAVEDARRFIRWFYEHVEQITATASTLDAHPWKAIFHPMWWIDRIGNNPAPFTVITAQDMREGNWTPIQNSEWSQWYLDQLEKMGKELRIWPYHCIVGTEGQRLIPAIEEMLSYHYAGRNAQMLLHEKGAVPQTEHYGAFSAEVPYPGNLEASGLNLKLVSQVRSYDKIYVAGQAKSHCVLESVAQFVASAPEAASKVYMLTDCMSAISGYEEATENRLKELVAQGVHLVTTADPF